MVASLESSVASRFVGLLPSCARSAATWGSSSATLDCAPERSSPPEAAAKRFRRLLAGLAGRGELLVEAREFRDIGPEPFGLLLPADDLGARDAGKLPEAQELPCAPY